MPNTFPRMYLNSESISLVVILIVLPLKDAIFIVPRPLQKLGGDSFVVSTVATPLEIMSLNYLCVLFLNLDKITFNTYVLKSHIR